MSVLRGADFGHPEWDEAKAQVEGADALRARLEAAERERDELRQWRNEESLRNAGMIQRIEEWSARTLSAEATIALVVEALKEQLHYAGGVMGWSDTLVRTRKALETLRSRVPIAEALREVVAAALPAVIRLQQGAMLHGGDENPPLEEAMLVAAETLEAALSRLRELGWPAHDEKGT